MSGPQRIFWGAARHTLMRRSSSPGFMADARRLQGAKRRSTTGHTGSNLKQRSTEYLFVDVEEACSLSGYESAYFIIILTAMTKTLSEV